MSLDYWCLAWAWRSFSTHPRSSKWCFLRGELQQQPKSTVFWTDNNNDAWKEPWLIFFFRLFLLECQCVCMYLSWSLYLCVLAYSPSSRLVIIMCRPYRNVIFDVAFIPVSCCLLIIICICTLYVIIYILLPKGECVFFATRKKDADRIWQDKVDTKRHYGSYLWLVCCVRWLFYQPSCLLCLWWRPWIIHTPSPPLKPNRLTSETVINYRDQSVSAAAAAEIRAFLNVMYVV